MNEPPPEWLPRRVTEGSGLRAAVGVGGLGIAIVVIALLSTPPTAAPGFATVSQPPSPIAAVSAPPVARALPARLSCHDLEPSVCTELTRAALASLPGDVPTATAAGVWASLICGSDSDCPTAELRGATLRGSVVLQFTSGEPEAWINVVDRAVDGGAPEIFAWIARWDRAAPLFEDLAGVPPPLTRILPR